MCCSQSIITVIECSVAVSTALIPCARSGARSPGIGLSSKLYPKSYIKVSFNNLWEVISYRPSKVTNKTSKRQPRTAETIRASILLNYLLHVNLVKWIGERILWFSPCLMADSAFASRAMMQRSTCERTFLRPRVRS